jgi:ankyrin repeat protein
MKSGLLNRKSRLTIGIVVAVVAVFGVGIRAELHQRELDRELISALVHSRAEQALILVNAGADPNARMKPTPVPSLVAWVKQLLHLAPAPRNDSPSALQLACGARWDNTLATIEWQLHGADSIALVKAMLDHGGDVNATGKSGITPLMRAVYVDRPGTIRLLLDRGANVNARRVDGWTALRYAVVWHSNDKALIQELRAHGADPNLADSLGITPLALAQTDPQVVALLK